MCSDGTKYVLKLKESEKKVSQNTCKKSQKLGDVTILKVYVFIQLFLKNLHLWNKLVRNENLTSVFVDVLTSLNRVGVSTSEKIFDS